MRFSDFEAWRSPGPVVCIENMDKRKPVGRSAAELGLIFEQLPEARFCFDIGHARQFDPTMIEATKILREFGARLRQVHGSEVNTRSKHDRVSYASMLAFREVAHLIPERIPLILRVPLGLRISGRRSRRFGRLCRGAMLLWRREVSAVVRSRFLLRFQLEINVRESSALSN
jgi:hypothetical protein